MNNEPLTPISLGDLVKQYGTGPHEPDPALTWLWDEAAQHLTRTQTLLLAMLGHHDRTGIISMFIDDMARRTGLSPLTVKTTLRDLERVGLIRAWGSDENGPPDWSVMWGMDCEQLKRCNAKDGDQ